MQSLNDLPGNNSVQNTVSYTWLVDNFASLNSNYYFSSPFSPPQNAAIQFELYLYPKRDRPLWNDQGTIIALYLASRGAREDLLVRFRISLLDAQGRKCCTSENITKFSQRRAVHNGQYSISRDYLLEPDNGLLVKGNLMVYCEVEIIPRDQADKNKENASRLIVGDVFDPNILMDYKSLLDERKFSDTILVIDEHEIQVHKAILSARSPVFAAMFEHEETQEAQEGRVNIVDMSFEVCNLLVEYIYTGKVLSLGEYALELLTAADKYQLDYLKVACSGYLSTHLTLDSVAEILLIADMHDAMELKLKCIDFIFAEGTNLKETDGWAKLKVARPQLGFELFEHLLAKNGVRTDALSKSK